MKRRIRAHDSSSGRPLRMGKQNSLYKRAIGKRSETQERPGYAKKTREGGMEMEMKKARGKEEAGLSEGEENRGSRESYTNRVLLPGVTNRQFLEWTTAL